MDMHKSQIRFGVSIVVICFTLLPISACSGLNSTTTIFLPPTAVVEPTFQPSLIESARSPISPIQTQQPTLEINCTNSLLYIEDLSIPDGSAISPGADLDKQWQVENNGTCNWDFRYSLRKISVDELGIEMEQALFPARSGSKVVIHVQFTAPNQAGTYTIIWQAFDPSNQPFGDPLSILFTVSP